ncbi:hypothetical protein ANN_09953 [Periplaneta americana]|uniref:Uncharacterized protein n=1 Tax=Periplaneta americana TaxID=6978 RepID=A0ABQ8TN40_PERAM|nr:hypothetical protein ANN_09953 [Periplaneta americana]
MLLDSIEYVVTSEICNSYRKPRRDRQERIATCTRLLSLLHPNRSVVLLGISSLVRRGGSQTVRGLDCRMGDCRLDDASDIGWCCSSHWSAGTCFSADFFEEPAPPGDVAIVQTIKRHTPPIFPYGVDILRECEMTDGQERVCIGLQNVEKEMTTTSWKGPMKRKIENSVLNEEQCQVRRIVVSECLIEGEITEPEVTYKVGDDAWSRLAQLLALTHLGQRFVAQPLSRNDRKCITVFMMVLRLPARTFRGSQEYFSENDERCTL